MNNLKKLRKAAGLTQKELGALIGTSFQHIYKMEKGKKGIGQQWLDKLVGVLNTTAGEILGHDLPQDQRSPIRWLSMSGIVQAEVFRKAFDTDGDNAPAMIPTDHPFADKLLVYRVKGNLFNKFYPDGTTLFILKVDDYPGPLKDGLHVIVRRNGPDGTVETTVREYQKKGKTILLHPRSTDQRYQNPFAISTDDAANRNAEIFAVVWEFNGKGPR